MRDDNDKVECQHLDRIECYSGGCILEYYCAYCTEWLGDRDVS